MRVDPGRFDKVTEHPDYPSAPAEPVLPTDAGLGVAAAAGPLMLGLFAGLFVLIAITLIIAVRPPLWFSLIFIAGGLVFAAGSVLLGRGLIAVRQAPIERMIAVVVKERTNVSGNDRSASTTYYTTLQTRDGTRTEYRTSHALFGKLVVDDIGVAYVRDATLDLGFTQIKSRSLIEFIRFDVDN
jgi:hypothetical protein